MSTTAIDAATPEESDSLGRPREPKTPRPNKPVLREIYSLPAPIRTFPLPSFYPNNPISLIHIVYKWLSQVLAPPSREPSVLHRGVWSPSTRSVHISDPISIRALWEQGFYGKGSLSRSEPNWLKREQIRRGLLQADVSEEITVGRRNERIAAKWERARLEQEAIERARLAELPATLGQPAATPLGLPSTPAVLVGDSKKELSSLAGGAAVQSAPESAGTDSSLPSTGNGKVVRSHLEPFPETGSKDVAVYCLDDDKKQGVLNGNDEYDSLVHAQPDNGIPRNDLHNETPKDGPGPILQSNGEQPSVNGEPLKRRKSVRFSTQVQSTTFMNSDPPSPNHSTPASLKDVEVPVLNGVLSPNSRIATLTESRDSALLPDIIDQEHLQLSTEEAFFLVFGLGALEVVDTETNMAISTSKLLALFRSYSYFPPRTRLSDLQPDDPFLIQYAVYHHFRSLGWVTRHGIKFGVDWMLYLRGPVFNHAEFGIVVMPSYTDRWWKDNGHTAPPRSWHWLHATTRVMAHVLKSTVLVYVDIPNPVDFATAMERDGSAGGYTAVLKMYRIREVMVRRWSSNRNRA